MEKALEFVGVIADLILMAGALAVAIMNITKAISDPHKKLKKKKKDYLKEEIQNTLDEKLPEILEKHDLETRQKYLADRQQYLYDIKKEVLEDARETLDGILQINLEQNEAIELLITSSKDMLRQRIMAIYHQYKAEKKMPLYAREMLNELYKDYKAQKGNSYIDKYYNRMFTWGTYDDENYD